MLFLNSKCKDIFWRDICKKENNAVSAKLLQAELIPYAKRNSIKFLKGYM